MRMSGLSVDFNKSSISSNNSSFKGNTVGNSEFNSPQYTNSLKSKGNKGNKGGKRNLQQKGNKRTSDQADSESNLDDITIQSLSYVKDAEIWFSRDEVAEETTATQVTKTINLDSFNIIKVIGKGSFGKVIQYFNNFTFYYFFNLFLF